MANNSKLLKKKAATLGRHKKKIRSKVIGSAERPRLSVFRSNQHLYLQIIDDVTGTTVVHASTMDQDLKGKAGKNVAGAKDVGTLIAKRAIAKNIKEIVFDRNGLRYHGRVKAVAEGAREGGLNF